jgi:hypothetical protein
VPPRRSWPQLSKRPRPRRDHAAAKTLPRPTLRTTDPQPTSESRESADQRLATRQIESALGALRRAPSVPEHVSQKTRQAAPGRVAKVPVGDTREGSVSRPGTGGSGRVGVHQFTRLVVGAVRRALPGTRLVPLSSAGKADSSWASWSVSSSAPLARRSRRRAAPRSSAERRVRRAGEGSSVTSTRSCGTRGAAEPRPGWGHGAHLPGVGIPAIRHRDRS